MVAKLKVSLDATHTSEYIAWLQVEIKAGGMRRFASDMSEMAAHVCFVGLFVAAETGVAVNPEHGAAIAPGVGDKIELIVFRGAAIAWMKSTTGSTTNCS